MKVFYHSDADGWACGAIAWNVLKDICKDLELFEINYHKPFPFEEIKEDEEVYLLDYSIPFQDLEKLIEKTRNIVWIDHHESSMKGYPVLPGVRDISKAACELVWKYFHEYSLVPWGIKYIGDRDTWKWIYGEQTKCYYNGLQMINGIMDPKSLIWERILCDEPEFMEKLMHDGEAIERYKMQQNEILIKTWAYEVEFEGYSCLVLNCSNTLDRLANKMLERGHSIVALYTFDGAKYTVTISTNRDDIDMSVIAKKYGGGGHKKIAGFVVPDLPFKKKEASLK